MLSSTKMRKINSRHTNLEVSTCGGQDENVVTVNELREDPDWVFEASLVLDVFGGQVVPVSWAEWMNDWQHRWKLQKVTLYSRGDLPQFLTHNIR